MDELSKNFIENYSEGLKYKFYKNGTCKVIGIGSCQDQDIFIPSYITHKKLFSKKKYKVTHIGEKAFYHKYIKSINIEDGITSIGSFAFCGCSSLTSITIPDTVTSIGDYAFLLCSSLTSIDLPSTLTSIGEDAFSACSSLKSIVIPEGVINIKSNVFSGCSSLENIKLPSTLTSIGDFAFYGCSSLTSIVIPESVTSIGICVFFSYFSSLIIYCEIENQPRGWVSFWNYSNRPVVWNHKNKK